jgi:hypothetical protein
MVSACPHSGFKSQMAVATIQLLSLSRKLFDLLYAIHSEMHMSPKHRRSILTGCAPCRDTGSGRANMRRYLEKIGGFGLLFVAEFRHCRWTILRSSSGGLNRLSSDRPSLLMDGLAFRLTKEDRAGTKGRPFFVCLGSRASFSMRWARSAHPLTAGGHCRHRRSSLSGRCCRKSRTFSTASANCGN